MCEILEPYKEKSFIGYKAVLVKQDGGIYSSFTGQKYNNGWLPKITEAKPLSGNWTFLNPSDYCFNPKMVGMTFAYRIKEGAEFMKSRIHSYPIGYRSSVWMVELVGKLHRAKYGHYRYGVVGRKIKFLKEV